MFDYGYAWQPKKAVTQNDLVESLWITIHKYGKLIWLKMSNLKKKPKTAGKKVKLWVSITN